MIGEDIDWYLQILCFAKTFDSINDIGIIYRQRVGSLSHAPKINSITDMLWILENWPDRIKSIVKNLATVNALMSVMAYYFANSLVLFTSYPATQTAPYRARLKSRSFLQDYAVTPRALTIKKFYKLLGFDITVFLLKIMAKIKTRQ